MSEGGKSEGMGAGKIVLIVVLVLGGLGVLCCGGFLVLFREQVGAGINLGMAGPKLAQRLAADIGPGATFSPVPGNDGGMTMLFGIPRAFTADEVAGLQDTAWRAYCEAYADGGFDVTGVAIGTVDPKDPMSVKGWAEHTVSVADIESRTGVKAPRNLLAAGGPFNVKVEGRADGEDEADDGGAEGTEEGGK